MGQVVDMSHIDALAAQLRAAAVEVQPVVSREVVTAARQVRDIARTLAPERSGRLKESIEATGTRGGALVAGKSLNADIGPTVFYGHMVEGGTVKQPPQPYMGPAIDRVEPLLAARVGLVGAEIIR